MGMSGWGRMNGGSGTFGGKSPPKTECDKISPGQGAGHKRRRPLTGWTWSGPSRLQPPPEQDSAASGQRHRPMGLPIKKITTTHKTRGRAGLGLRLLKKAGQLVFAHS